MPAHGNAGGLGASGWFSDFRVGQSDGAKPPVEEVIVTIVLIIVLVCVVIVIGGALFVRQTAERRQFGPEYDRLAQEVGPRRAKAELTKRQKRVDGLGIKPLSTAQRAAYEAQWETAQEQFIDSPRQATQSAAQLVMAVAAEVGYPVDDQEQLLADLSVHHGRYVDGYRSALRTTGNTAVPDSAAVDGAAAGNAATGIATDATEAYRQALLDYRALFNDLLGEPTDADGQPRLPWRERMAARQPS
jgi:hypothetical protein